MDTENVPLESVSESPLSFSGVESHSEQTGGSQAIDQTVTLKCVIPLETYVLLQDFLAATEMALDEALEVAVHHLLGSWLFDQQQQEGERVEN